MRAKSDGNCVMAADEEHQYWVEFNYVSNGLIQFSCLVNFGLGSNVNLYSGVVLAPILSSTTVWRLICEETPEWNTYKAGNPVNKKNK
ncbi:unnamed protein product [Colias eurytheme]|nr:unnamed protein product [Colias eurytheme]